MKKAIILFFKILISIINIGIYATYTYFYYSFYKMIYDHGGSNDVSRFIPLVFMALTILAYVLIHKWQILIKPVSLIISIVVNASIAVLLFVVASLLEYLETGI